MEAILLQKGETNPRTKNPTQHPIVYYSSTFIPAEQNYDIYDDTCPMCMCAGKQTKWLTEQADQLTVEKAKPATHKVG